MITCDHCRSDSDHTVEGMRGEYCSAGCYSAEEIDGPQAHDSAIDIRECPGCYGDYLTDTIHVVQDTEAESATAKLADWTPSGMYSALTDAVDRKLYDETEGDTTLEDLGSPVGASIGWAAVDEEKDEVVHVELDI